MPLILRRPLSVPSFGPQFSAMPLILRRPWASSHFSPMPLILRRPLSVPSFLTNAPHFAAGEWGWGIQKDSSPPSLVVNMIFVNNYACQRESHAGTSPSPTALALHRRVSAATSPLSTALAFHGLSPKSEWGIGGGKVSFGYLTPLLLVVNVNILTKLTPVLNI